VFGQKRGALRRLGTLKLIGGAHNYAEQLYLRHPRLQLMKFSGRAVIIVNLPVGLFIGYRL